MKLKKIIFILMIILLSSQTVFAAEIAKAGDMVVQEGDYDSLRIVAGNKVIDKSNVDGVSIVAGNEITLEGSTPYGLYAGNTILVKEKIAKDIFVAGNDITLTSEATIGRDAYLAGNNIKIETNIPRDLRLGSMTADLRGITIGGDAYVASENIILDENTVITGKLTYPEEAKVTGIDLAKVGEVKITKTKKLVIEHSLKEKIINFMTSYFAALVTMLVLFYLFPKTKDKIDKLELKVEVMAKITGIGVLVLIITPIIAAIAVFTGVLTPISLITIAIYITALYLSSLLVSYIIGNQIVLKLFKKENKYLSLAIGILIVKLIKLIPIVGPICKAIILLYGLGIVYKLLNNKKLS